MVMVNTFAHLLFTIHHSPLTHLVNTFVHLLFTIHHSPLTHLVNTFVHLPFTIHHSPFTIYANSRRAAVAFASTLSFINDSARPIAINISPPSIIDSPLGLKISSPLPRLMLTITISSSERMLVSASLRRARIDA